jgi:hypothetical protein
MVGDYAPASVQRYKSRASMIAAFPEPHERYEDNGVLLLEDSNLEFDEPFIAATTFPAEWKKIGTVNGITLPPIVYRDGSFHRTQNPLCGLIKDDASLLKLYSELLRIELGFKLLVADLFPRYRNIHWYNCTFRFVKTADEAAHLDAFGNGRAFPPESRLQRVKFFLNVDSEPRVWTVGPTLPGVLAHCRDKLPAALPDDVNVLCHQLNQSGILADTPRVRVEIPPRGIVFANGSTVVHQVVRGHRMVCIEGVVRGRADGSCARSEWDHLGDWIRRAGYAIETPAVDSATARS